MLQRRRVPPLPSRVGNGPRGPLWSKAEYNWAMHYALTPWVGGVGGSQPTIVKICHQIGTNLDVIGPCSGEGLMLERSMMVCLSAIGGNSVP